MHGSFKLAKLIGESISTSQEMQSNRIAILTTDIRKEYLYYMNNKLYGELIREVRHIKSSIKYTDPDNTLVKSFCKFIIKYDDGFCKRHFFEVDDSFIVGRIDESDIYIDDPSISRVNAFIVRTDVHIHVLDFWSISGTKLYAEHIVNGELKITKLESMPKGRNAMSIETNNLKKCAIFLHNGHNVTIERAPIQICKTCQNYITNDMKIISFQKCHHVQCTYCFKKSIRHLLHAYKDDFFANCSYNRGYLLPCTICMMRKIVQGNKYIEHGFLDNLEIHKLSHEDQRMQHIINEISLIRPKIQVKKESFTEFYDRFRRQMEEMTIAEIKKHYGNYELYIPFLFM